MEFEKGTKKWAIQQMLKRKKVRRTVWDIDCFIFADESGIFKFENHREVNLNQLGGTTWELYEEPKKKKKVTYYRYTYRAYTGSDFLKTSDWTTRTFIAERDNTLVHTETREFEVPK